MNTAPDNPGVIARPPLLYLSSLILGLALDFAAPIRLADDPTPQHVAGGLLLVAGIGLMTVAMRRFRAAGTNVPTYLPAEALVIAGPYRFSRNPIYVAMTSIYLGIALLLGNGWMLLIAIPLLVTMRYGVVAREERYLEGKFGDPYRDYKRRVRRWL
jgi:protein-S-isoprenylcysteine O-methyltransferase Ste14